MTQQPWLEPTHHDEPTDDDLTRRGEHPYQRADQVELHGDPAPPPAPAAQPAAPAKQEQDDPANQQFVLAIISLAVGIPITAIVATNVTPSLVGVLIVWIAIVGVNLGLAWSRRR